MTSSTWKTASSLVLISRPAVWFILPAVFFAAAWFSLGAAYYPVQTVLIALALTFPMSLHGYGLNDIYDLASDRANPRKTIRIQSEKDARIVAIAAHLGGLIVLAAAATTLEPIPILISIGLVAVSYAYSMPPIRLRVRPPFDSLTNGIGYFLLPATLGWTLHRPISQLPIDVYAIAIAVSGIHSFASIMDYTPDHAAGDRTAATVYGKRGAALFCLASMIGCYLLLPFWYPIVGIGLSALILIYPNERLARFGTYLFYLTFVAIMIAYYYFLFSHRGNPFWAPGALFTR
ncbi:MAG: UbiA family prenyltransferase [Deltaproteobacteria bacterium]|nr:UbiA family prenyltransferase [Deltaproteobacteria bacterium]MBN2671445.1 UbiA family prenyltransferase [Deltaproteobacteria bacterium]